MFEYSIDEKDHPKSLALRGRVDAMSSAEIQKVLDRLMQAGERMILVDFAEVNEEDVKRRWEFIKHVVTRSFKPPSETVS